MCRAFSKPFSCQNPYRELFWGYPAHTSDRLLLCRWPLLHIFFDQGRKKPTRRSKAKHHVRPTCRRIKRLSLFSPLFLNLFFAPYLSLKYYFDILGGILYCVILIGYTPQAAMMSI